MLKQRLTAYLLTLLLLVLLVGLVFWIVPLIHEFDLKTLAKSILSINK